jgi:hydrogenase expression/formation protein HypC
MCLAIPTKIVQLLPDNNAMAEVSGIRKKISLAMVEDVRVGDYVIVHVGFALNKLDQEDAEKTLALFQELRGQV